MAVRTVPSTQAVTPGAPGASDAIERGTLVDRYVVLDVLGEGGMGTVFAAHDASLDRNIALKIVRSEHAGR
jgi:serine/threonine protein kinase